MFGRRVTFVCVRAGQPGVGKTCLVYRYLYNTFGETISTIGASFAMKKVDTDSGRPCNLGIWDTAGQERFDSLSSFYCRGARAAIICFDLTDRTSFECLQQKWIRKVTEEAEVGCHICSASAGSNPCAPAPLLLLTRPARGFDSRSCGHEARPCPEWRREPGG